MDDIRGSFSKLKKDIKHRLAGSKRKTDKTRAGGGGDGVDSSSSLPQPEAHVVTGSDREREVDGSNVDDENVESSTAADENKSGWKSTASASAKLLLRGVRDSADAFGPLKAVAGGLCFILDNCEVSSLPHTISPTLIGAVADEGKQKGNRVIGTPGQGASRTTLRTRF